ncbi:MAG: hypothetical protein HY725_06285 [Candidatus Rokubacteria bacterium]|nr:hypothetical protein [Candidatus Rokubacteria bacterium]
MEQREFDLKVVDDWVSFWNTYDLSQLDRLFLTDARVSYFSSEKPGLIKGIDALRKHHEGFGFVKGGKVQSNQLSLGDMNVDVFGPVVLVTALWRFQRANADKVQTGPVTLVYAQVGDEHRIAHAHFANYA